jgi:hypothetical protein
VLGNVGHAFVECCGCLCVCVLSGTQAASIDQFDRLLFVTIAPLVALVVLFCVHAAAPHMVRFLSCVKNPALQDGATLRLFVYRIALVMLFTIYPGLSVEIVKSFRWAPPCGLPRGGSGRAQYACQSLGPWQTVPPCFLPVRAPQCSVFSPPPPTTSTR